MKIIAQRPDSGMSAASMSGATGTPEDRRTQLWNVPFAEISSGVSSVLLVGEKL